MTDQTLSPSSALEPRPERWLDGLLRGIYVIRVPVAMGILTILVLTLLDQVLEVHRVLTQERAVNPFHVHWLLSLASLTALSVVLWQIARQHAEGDQPGEHIIPHPLGTWVLRWGPRLVAMLPLLGAAVGIWLSRLPNLDIADVPEPLKESLRLIAQLRQHFIIGAIICVALAAIVFVAITIFERGLTPVGSSNARRLAVFSNWLLFPLIILASIVLLIRDPVHLPQLLGSIPIFALWMVNLAVLTALFARYYRIFGVPIVVTLIVLLVCFELFGLTDNHRFRHKPDPNIQRPTVEAAFRAWLASRKDIQAYRAVNKPYPVYVVAAEGGGLYAAYQSAKFLTRMQDLCSNFAQHVFTVSSVSGGSLGAAVFAGLSRTLANGEAKPCLDRLPGIGEFERKADGILSRDLLAPVVWGALFPDFLQRFVPWPISALDRARALEYAFEDAWQYGRVAGANPLQASLFDLCGPGEPACSAGATPSLAINVANVETGMQMVLGPLDFSSIGPPWTGSAKVFDFFSNGVDPVNMPLSTAVGLSARFPWISPAGWYSFPDTGSDPKDKTRKRRMSFVDGGYVDNSGVATASKLAQSLSELQVKDPSLPPIEVKLIMISAAWIPFDRFWIDPPENQAQSEFLSPLVAAIATWQGRGFTTQFDLASDPKPGFKIVEAGVYYNFMPLPLGWQLSSLSRNYIDLFKGHPEKCDPNQLDRSLQNHATLANTYINRANCVAAEIARDLTPTAAPLMMRAITPAK